MKGNPDRHQRQDEGVELAIVVNDVVDSPLKEEDPKDLISPTGTEWSNGSNEELVDDKNHNGDNGNRWDRYGKIAAALALIILLSVTTTLITIFVRSDNGNRNKNQLDAFNENGKEGGRDRPGLIGGGGRKQPTPKPTGSPTAAPSERPSTSPSDAPSLIPSARPSSQPSSNPSGLPSISPTQRPTTSPSESPTSHPTRERIPDDFRFRLKMYWERRYYWQEEWDERRWCAECTTCRELTTSGFGEGCWDRDGRDRHDCDRGDQLWLMRCDGWDGGSGNAQFELIRHDYPHEADQIKIRGSNLCLERATNRHLDLQRCKYPTLDDPDSIRQLFVGIQLDGDPFVIQPYQQNWRPNQYDDPVEVELCVSQHHHPKAGEVLYLSECELAANWDTILWEFY